MQIQTEAKQPSKQKFKMPDAYVLLFLLPLLCAIATYFVPAGEFKKGYKRDRYNDNTR